ncbi:hypothetical protein KSF_087410 [Reticulibacter mediterranei]|uniref:Uncharacterized protein n=1 Tax=Reticulibacter mediterranei TaxID=2778369 RepID=A0A8J3N7K2_9CHLR|nr:hypothetical protein KSF_087410 [Reticulibacter mediterranei]
MKGNRSEEGTGNQGKYWSVLHKSEQESFLAMDTGTSLAQTTQTYQERRVLAFPSSSMVGHAEISEAEARNKKQTGRECPAQ